MIYNFFSLLARFCGRAQPAAAVGAVPRADEGEPAAAGRAPRAATEAQAVQHNLKLLLARKPPVPHLPPLCFLRAWDTRSTAHHDSCEFLRRVRAGVTQYIVRAPRTPRRALRPAPCARAPCGSRAGARLQVVKLGCAMAAFVLKPLGQWGEGHLVPSNGFFWCAMATNVSQAMAIYCLILFYKGLHCELSPLQPFGKFVAVKAVVFFSFWQSLAIALLVNLDVIKPSEIYPEASELAAATQVHFPRAHALLPPYGDPCGAPSRTFSSASRCSSSPSSTTRPAPLPTLRESSLPARIRDVSKASLLPRRAR